MKKVSIIVPVYNVELYLKECLNSLIKQTYKAFEIILIDDGSTDLSGKICDDYKLKDNRIKVIHKKNGGVSSARNLGLSSSKGEYILFVDSDDYVEKDYIKTLVKESNNCDLVCCSYYTEFLNKKINNKICNKSIVINTIEAQEKIYNQDSFSGFLWNKLFKKDIIDSNKLKFNESIHMCEDQLFIVQYLLKVNSIKLIPNMLYHYRMRKGSIVWNNGSKKRLTVFDSYKLVNQIYNKNNINNIFFKKSLYEELIHNKKKFNIKKFLLDNNISLKLIKKEVVNSNKISNKQKIKFLIKIYLPNMYMCYINVKLRKLKQFN